MLAEWCRFGGDGGRSGGSLEEHERGNPQLSAFNYNYPLSLLPVWLMRGGVHFFLSLCSPSLLSLELRGGVSWGPPPLLPRPLVTGRKADSRGW